MSGFIKQVGGGYRMRFARPGFDASNLNLPNNQVAFDSLYSTHNIYTTGFWTGTFSQVSSLSVIGTFPSLGYQPFATGFAVLNETRYPIYPGRPYLRPTPPASAGTEFSVDLTTVRLHWPVQSQGNVPISVGWVIFRTPLSG